ncbi:MAG: TatD family hydrolase [Patescibacteria group bacterium]|jgi:TatD DNase family protein
MYDTHAHLNFRELKDKIDQIVQESKKVGLTGIIIASSNLADSKEAVKMCENYLGFLYASVGIHPQKTDPENKMSIEEQLKSLEDIILESKRSSAIVAIGETGLDFSEAPPGEENRTKEDQGTLFKGQISLAQKYELPLAIHAREAVDETIEVLSSLTHQGVFHCYAGGKKRIQKILNLPGEWYFGFDGNLTYDEGLQNTLKLVPENRIIIETDSPYLTPVPHRGETNTPAYLPLIQEKINEIWGKDLTEQIVHNTRKLFKLNY